MEKVLACRDLGALTCGYTACGRTEDEILTRFEGHAHAVHKTAGFSKDFYERARGAVQTGTCTPEQDRPGVCKEGCFIMACPW